MDSQKVIITVHERLDAPGFVVKVKVDGEEVQRVVRFPTDTRDEAEALARSIHSLASSPRGILGIEALLAGAESP